MSVDLVTQVGALVGTSILLYLVTKPRGSASKKVSRGADNNSDVDDSNNSDATTLKGVKRYSSYHRSKYYANLTTSSFSSTSQ